MPRSSTEPPPRPDRPLPSPKARPGQLHRRVEHLGGYRGPGHRCLRPGERRELSRPGPRRELASSADAAASPTDRPGPGPGPRRSHRPGRRRELSRPWSTARPGPIDRCLRPRRALGRSTAELNAWGGTVARATAASALVHDANWPAPPMPRPPHRSPWTKPRSSMEPPPGRGCDLPCQHRPADLVLHGVVDIYSPQRQKPTHYMLLVPLHPSLVRWDRRRPRPGRGCERRRAAGPPGRRSRACQVRIAPGPKRVRTRHGSRREQSPASATGYPRGG